MRGRPRAARPQRSYPDRLLSADGEAGEGLDLRSAEYLFDPLFAVLVLAAVELLGEGALFEELADDLKVLLDSLDIKKCTLIGHSIGGSIASLYAKQYSQNVEAIIFINASSVRIPDKDLEKHFTTRKIALTQGMNAVAEWARHETLESEKAFKDDDNWNQFKHIFTKTSVEGFVAATNSLYSMPEDVTDSLRDANYKVFGIVGEKDEVFMRLMHKMKEEISRFELRIIEDSDHWVIVEHPEEFDKAIIEFLDIIYP